MQEGKSGRILRRPQQDYPAATVDQFCTAVLNQGENGNPDHEFDRGCPLLSAQKPQCLRAPYSFEQHLPEHANLQFNPILAKQTGIGLVFNDPILRQKHGEWGLSCNGCPDFQGIIFSNRINAAISTDGAPAGAHRRGEMFVRPYRPLER